MLVLSKLLGALGLADVDSYGNADSTQDEDSAFHNAAMSELVSYLAKRKEKARTGFSRCKGRGQPKRVSRTRLGPLIRFS